MSSRLLRSPCLLSGEYVEQFVDGGGARTYPPRPSKPPAPVDGQYTDLAESIRAVVGGEGVLPFNLGE
jgi:hypothetical protein